MSRKNGSCSRPRSFKSVRITYVKNGLDKRPQLIRSSLSQPLEKSIKESLSKSLSRIKRRSIQRILRRAPSTARQTLRFLAAMTQTCSLRSQSQSPSQSLSQLLNQPVRQLLSNPLSKSLKLRRTLQRASGARATATRASSLRFQARPLYKSTESLPLVVAYALHHCLSSTLGSGRKWRLQARARIQLLEIHRQIWLYYSDDDSAGNRV